MSRRSLSLTSDDSREAKRPRLDVLTPDDYRNGLILAPMVRSGALPTRLFALKHGAKLVWGPEMVDKAMLHAERVVDPKTGVISYNGKSKAMFTTHPIEKPYLIFQLGSSSPELAVQAAKVVQDDVAGIDLNCGCPKPFSTHSGMGAALLSNPDLLCAILTALAASSRRATRNMRQREPALIHRLREVVEFVRGLGRDVAVVQNGDCVGYEDGRRIRAITTADSCMIATAAESNPTIFSPTPFTDLEKTLIPSYVRLCKYFNNHPSSTKFCVAQFKGTHTTLTKAHGKAVRDTIVKGKGYSDWEGIMAEGFDAQGGLEAGEKEFKDIVAVIEARAANGPPRSPSCRRGCCGRGS
ncbi:hypothetical protein EWM64_g10068 [Hericium alpestre]|uniref:DUS-like FMN-binding domain-containing protein n=1 Tax=Hericium alpestre TaxID=135208 RepID=A0A4Y9ZHP6_9AGAM|nr:hypothetical protein EWM64_g10068 [Hericium alpestre]